ncbi:MAG: ABC transporter permease subunit [Deltaproteobacteria bacterium]|nr:ABC transporter permease subunit [Deltaproteobacteria bacterium]
MPRESHVWWVLSAAAWGGEISLWHAYRGDERAALEQLWAVDVGPPRNPGPAGLCAERGAGLQDRVRRPARQGSRPVRPTSPDGRWLFGRQLFNSLVIAAATAIVGMGLACTTAYAMSRWAFPGCDRAMGLFLLTQMFPGVVAANPLYILLDALHLLDSMTRLILVYSTTTVPFATWNLKGYFDTLPRELEEAAMLDGASRWTPVTLLFFGLWRFLVEGLTAGSVKG